MSKYVFPTTWVDSSVSEGMTLIDHFAGLAMQALITKHTGATSAESITTVAEVAYSYAEAMVAERDSWQ